MPLFQLQFRDVILINMQFAKGVKEAFQAIDATLDLALGLIPDLANAEIDNGKETLSLDEVRQISVQVQQLSDCVSSLRELSGSLKTILKTMQGKL